MSDSLPTTPEAVRQQAAMANNRRRRKARPASRQWRRRGLMGAYIVFVLLPIYWLLNMSFQSNTEILGGLTLWPEDFTVEHYAKIFTDSSWYMGYVNSITYVLMNMLISIAVALPAAYAFSRYKFIGDKHLFFWLLTNMMAPPAVFLLPYFQLYYTVGLFDTHVAVALAHCLFNIPLAVWILEGFMSGVPKEIDETAFIDGYSFPKFFVKIFIPMISSGIGVTLFFLFMFSWVELLLASTLTSTGAQPIGSVMTQTKGASGIDWGTLAAAGTLTILPGILVVYFVRNHIAKGFALGRT
ncbi:carbohydrate ABC transporter permease [Halomonas kalidii]